MKKYFIIVIALLSLGSCQKSNNAEKKQPNILLFLVDDLGWADVGYNHNTELYETPNIDALAQGGMVFNNAYASHPRCVPSRYSIMTGKYPARAQMPGPGEGKLNVISGDEGKLKKGEITIGTALKEQGYSTYFLGKWHLATSGTFPEDAGFDINIAGGKAGSPIGYFYPYNEGKQKNVKAPIKGLDEGAVEGEYLTDRMTDEAIKILESHLSSNNDNPFFTVLSHYSVHEPIQAHEENIVYFEGKLKGIEYKGPDFINEGTGATKMYHDNATYAAMIKSTDESLGRIVEFLKQKEELDNTLIVFFSDNGGLSNKGSRPRNVVTSNYPLRAGKGHLYEGGVRVPMFAYWAGHIKPNSQTSTPVCGTDFISTFVDIAGGDLVKNIDGLSIKPIMLSETDKIDRALYWHSPSNRSKATGDEKSTAILKNGYKLIDFYEVGRVELYNVNKDISEEYDISEENPVLRTEMLKDIESWREKHKVYMGI